MSTERGADDAEHADPTDHTGDAGRSGHRPAEQPDLAQEYVQEPAPARRTRRGPRLAVVAVAAAVLLAGGGGAYWATAGSGSGKAAGGTPAPLVVDGGGDPQELVTGGATAAGGTTYQLTGSLPKGPRSAPVYRAGGVVDAPAVRGLAGLLGMSGQVTVDGDVWRVLPVPGRGPALLVNRDAPGTWTYNRVGPDPVAAVGSGSAPSSGNAADPAADAGSPPVSADRARAAAAPVFEGLGLAGARIDTAQTVGAERLVIADPLVGGLPTHGWSTVLRIGPDGVVLAGSGQLAPLVKGDSYPVVSAEDAFRQLDIASAEHPDRGTLPCGVAGPDEPDVMDVPAPLRTPTTPGQDRTLPHSLPCVPGSGHPVQVRGAVFGLSAEFVAGERTLVPSWLFEAAPAGVARTSVVAQSAVDPAFVRGPGSGRGTEAPGGPPSASPGLPIDPGGPAQPVGPAPPSGPGMPPVPARPPHPPSAPGLVKVSGYHDDGSTLAVTFFGGICSTYRTTATETAGEVRVAVTSQPKGGKGQVCPMLARSFTQKVVLAQPLGGRTVVDASDGQPVKGH